MRQADLALHESERELNGKREALIRTEALSERYQTEQEGLSQQIREKLVAAQLIWLNWPNWPTQMSRMTRWKNLS